MPAAFPNYTGVKEFATPERKSRVNGINGSNSINSVLNALTDLGLCTSSLAKPLLQLAAAGQIETVGKLLPIDIQELNRALEKTDASVSSRLQFKSALTQLGFLK